MQNSKEAEATVKMPKLITKYKTASLLGVCTRTVFNFRKQGKLQGYRIGSEVKYKLTEVLGYINESKTN